MGIEFAHDPKIGGFRFVHDEAPPRFMAELRGRELVVWMRRYAGDLMAGLELLTEAQEFREMIDADEATVDAVVDAILAYDRAGIFRDRDWIDTNLDSAQVVLIGQTIVRTHA